MNEINLIDLMFLFTVAFILSIGGLIHANLDDRGIKGFIAVGLVSLFGTFYTLYLTSYFTNDKLDKIRGHISAELNAKERALFDEKYVTNNRLKPLLGFLKCKNGLDDLSCKMYLKELVSKNKII